MINSLLSKKLFFLLVTILMSVLLSIMWLPKWLIWVRPEFTLLVMIYWILEIPDTLNVTFSLLLGLLTDAITYAPIGESALAFLIIGYFIVKFQKRIILFEQWRQAAVIFVLTLFYLAIVFWIQKVSQTAVNVSPLYLLSSVTTTLFWPPFLWVAKRF